MGSFGPSHINQKTKEVYDELFTDEFDADLEEDRRKFLKEKLELVPNYRYQLGKSLS